MSDETTVSRMSNLNGTHEHLVGHISVRPEAEAPGWLETTIGRAGRLELIGQWLWACGS